MEWNYRTYGIPDELFDKVEDIVMTKEEIRIISISKLRLREGDIVVDIGCGSGSVSIELANIVKPSGIVYAIDKNFNAIEVTKKNAAKFSVEKYIKIIHGEAPEVLSYVPNEVDGVFIGGSSGRFSEILTSAYRILKKGRRIVANLTLIENVYTALSLLKNLDAYVEIIFVQIARSSSLGYGTFFRSLNPVYIVVGEKK